VIQSNVGSPYNTIDPSILQDTTTGRMWMSFGSYWNGIYVTELDTATGKRKSGSSDVHVASSSSIEASALVQHDGAYYLFVDWGSCCSGIDSTYNIRVGRGNSPTGPFLDKNGVNMAGGGGSLFLDDDGSRIGPGHFALFSEAGQDYFGYHYYDGNRNGAPTFGMRNLYWTADGWPSYADVNPDWTGAASANWSAAGNWTIDGVPNGVGHVATFRANSANRYSVTLDGGGKTLGTVNFRSASSFDIGTTGGNTLTLDAAPGESAATINVADGNHTIAAPIAAVDPLRVNVTPVNRTLTLSGAVSGPSLAKYGQGTLSLGGGNTYTGSVHVKRGTLDVTGSVTAGAFSSVGQSVGDNATLILRGAGRFTANGDLNIGDTGDGATGATGTLELRESASITVNAAGGFFVGSGFSANTRAAGTVNQTGGTLTANGNFDGAFVIGGRNSNRATGAYNQSGGTVNANTNVQVGGRGTGTVNQNGGAFNASGYLSIGRYAGATGVWNISGGALSQTDPARFLIVGEGGSGTLNLGGTGRVNAAGPVRVGANAGSAGIINLDNDGIFTTPAIVRGAGTATVNFDGGTLRAATSSGIFLQGLTNAYVQDEGALFDSQAFSIAVAQPLLHDPALGSTPDAGLTKNGTGTLTLSGNNTYTGPTTVIAGTLALSGSIASSSGVTVNPVATFDAAASQRLRKLTLAGGRARITPAPGAPKVLIVGDNTAAQPLAITAPGALDLATNALIVDHSPAATNALQSVRNLIIEGFHGGDWLGAGAITSTDAAASPASRGIGYALGTEAGPGGTFLGQPADASSVLARYTLLGDADLSGTVDFNDLARLAQHYNTNLAQTSNQSWWYSGDFTYDGQVNFDDLTRLAQNYNAALPAEASFTPDFAGDLTRAFASVPEPSVTVFATFAGLIYILRRRQH
jgi:autotransporter-associated beta strand protein